MVTGSDQDLGKDVVHPIHATYMIVLWLHCRDWLEFLSQYGSKLQQRHFRIEAWLQKFEIVQGIG